MRAAVAATVVMTTAPPHKDEVPGGSNAEHSGDNETSNEPILHAEASDIKAALVAQLAHRGVALFELADGSFIGSKWNLSRRFPDLHAVAVWSRQLGGA